MDVVNLQLAKHPLNWFVIFFMLVIAAIAGHLFASYVGHEPASN